MSPYMSKENIHNYDRRLENTLVRINNSSIEDKNKVLLLRFYNYMILKDLSIAKIERYLYDAHRFCLMLNKDLENSTKEEVENVVVEIERNSWTPNSKSTFKILVRKLYNFIEGIDEKGVCSFRVKGIKTNVKKSNERLPEDLLTEEEINNIIRCAENVRDKALISTLYESGCRISELALIKIKNLQFDSIGAKMIVAGKTGSRMIRLILSSPYLKEWISEHPFNNETCCPVWISREQKKCLSYERIAIIIKKASKKAGITKKVNPHNFRHSRATHLARYLTEAQMKFYFGWTQSSDMASVYVHLSSRDVESTLLKMYGLEVEDEKKNQISLKKCLRCNTSPEKITDVFCPKCGLILDEKEAKKILQSELRHQQAEDIMEKLIQDSEIKELIKKKLAV